MTPEIVIWSAAAAFLLLAWPLSRRMKHPDMKPLAAWLVFVSVFALAGGALFAALAGALALVGATGRARPPRLGDPRRAARHRSGARRRARLGAAASARRRSAALKGRDFDRMTKERTATSCSTDAT